MWLPCDQDGSAGTPDPCGSGLLNAWEWKHSFECLERKMGVEREMNGLSGCWYLDFTCTVTMV